MADSCCHISYENALLGGNKKSYSTALHSPFNETLPSTASETTQCDELRGY